MTLPLRLGTRRSTLARTQSEHVAAALRAATGREVQLVDIVTSGDTSTAPLVQIGGTGVFVSALRDALLAGQVDLAVHSLKDLPTGPAEGLTLAAVPPREDPRDALVARDGLGLDGLSPGARVGTGSPRRAAQLRALGLGLEVVDIRGNVGTRLALVAEGRLDGVVLALAGLRRLGRAAEATDVLSADRMLPAPGQGALAVECHAGDAETQRALAHLDDATTRACVAAERALLTALEAGCTAPVGALAVVREGVLELRALVAALDGSRVLRRTGSARPFDAVRLGRELAAALVADGAADLVTAEPPSRSTQQPEHPPPTTPQPRPNTGPTHTVATGRSRAVQERNS